MVLIPWERDQPGVAARARALGVAEIVPRPQLTGKALGEAVDRVLGGSSYRENSRRTAQLLQATDPVSLACDHIEALVS